ncbi:unnamed protein product [Bursaphelenchus okinawaensis]|uniref:ETS domain-containing protein n=1 Tax=Bursaphelenchus okinawaensis TaxID=465554 RepID=A0A811KUH1_9BILA|nr:unnamed protein product [Bursaphelenchus okinawaensis]CAG9111228.1 unnamed protein product [Bursaphelenchus okinawaensis]
MVRRCLVLWKFLLDLLADERYTHIIRWTNQERAEFKLVEPETVAQLWGLKKKNRPMNYENLSRAIRTYYKKNIMKKVKGKEYAYRFVTLDKHILKESEGTSDESAYSSLSTTSNTSTDSSMEMTNDLSNNCRLFSVSNIVHSERSDKIAASPNLDINNQVPQYQKYQQYHFRYHHL